MIHGESEMPGTTDDYLAFKLRVITSVIYTLASVPISRD
jgi:hypothetical protein